MVILLGEIRSLNVGDLAIVKTAEALTPESKTYALSPDYNAPFAKILGFHGVNILHTLYVTAVILYFRPTKVILPGGQIVRNNLHWAMRFLVITYVAKKLSFERVGVDDRFSKKTNWLWRNVFRRSVDISCRDKQSTINLHRNFGIESSLDKDTAYKMRYPITRAESEGMCASFMGYFELQRHMQMSERRYLDLHLKIIEEFSVKSLLCSCQEDYEYWKNQPGKTEVYFTNNIEEYLDKLAGFKGIISSRMHPLIFGECLSKNIHVLVVSNKLLGYYEQVKNDSNAKISYHSLQ